MRVALTRSPRAHLPGAALGPPERASQGPGGDRDAPSKGPRQGRRAKGGQTGPDGKCGPLRPRRVLAGQVPSTLSGVGQAGARGGAHELWACSPGGMLLRPRQQGAKSNEHYTV